MPKNLNEIAVELDQKGVSYCMATIINSKGSTPRHAGAKMLITREAFFGTIGGGALEHKVIEDARKQLHAGQPRMFNYPLGPLLGQCCGGEVDVFIEPVIPSKKIIIFGAGHIAEHLVPMLKNLNFHITLVDERPERIELPAFNAADEKICELPADALKSVKFSDELYIVVLTHAHIHDEAIVEFCLDKPFKYLGMIGSINKWEKFKARYRSRGFNDEQTARVITPIGIDIGAETPFEIAVSIVAELISTYSSPKGFRK